MWRPPPQTDGGVMNSYWTEKTWQYEQAERVARAAEAALAKEVVQQQRAERRARRELRRQERAGRRPLAVQRLLLGSHR